MPQKDKKPPVSPINIEYINDFSGGLNSTISGSLLNKNEAQVATDLSFEQKGTIVPRRGRRKRYATPYSTEPCTGLGMLSKQDGTNHLVMASGDKLYSDAPRMSKRFAEKADWLTGTANEYADTSTVDGKIVVNTGVYGMLHDGLSLTGFSPFSSVAGSTYGWKFKLSRDMRAFRLSWLPLLSGVEYTISVWEGWLNEGSTTYNRLSTYKKTPTVAEANVIQTASLDISTITAGVLYANKSYMITIFCPSANGIARYYVGGTPAKPSYITYEGSFSTTTDAYPTTVTTSSATFYCATLKLEYLNNEITVDTKAGFDTGVSTNVVYDDVSEISLTHASPTAVCSTLTKDLDRLVFDGFTLDTGIYSFLKTTTTNSFNKTGLLYPGCIYFTIASFPATSAYGGASEISNASYQGILDVSNGSTLYTTGSVGGRFSGLAMSFYMPVEVYDKDKLDSLSFSFNAAVMNPTTAKYLFYALPYGGVELGASNTQVLVGTFDPNVSKQFNLIITADPKRFVNPTTGEIKLYMVPDTISIPFSIYSARMNNTWTLKTTEQLRAELSVDYTINYGGTSNVTGTLSYMQSDFSLARFDKTLTRVTIGAQSVAYSKAILPALKVCGKGGLSLLRKSNPVRSLVKQPYTYGTLTSASRYDTGNLSTRLLLHFDDNTVDSSVLAGTATHYGSVTYVAGQFGKGASYPGALASYTTIPTSVLELGTSDFTIDWWEYRRNSGTILGNLNIDYRGMIIGYNGTSMYMSTGSNTTYFVTAFAYGTVKLNQWVHRAIVRVGNMLYSYDNGALFASTACVGSVGWGADVAVLGRYRAETGQSFNGIIDEFRVSNVAVWTAPFTPPTLQHEGYASGVGLTRQGVDKTLAVTRNTGTYTNTVYDAGKDAVTLAVDPGKTRATLPGYLYAKDIIIPEAQIDATLTDFPLTVYLTPSNFDFTKAKDNGSDIRFTDTSLNLLKFERKEHVTNESQLNLSTALSSLGQGIRNWSSAFTPANAYDGNLTTSFAVSSGSEDHNGYGFTLNFNSPRVISRVQIQVNYLKATEWCLEYYNGSAWVRVGVYNVEANRVGELLTLTVPTPNISSSNWRAYITATSAVVANCYAFEIMAYAINTPRIGVYNVMVPTVSSTVDTKIIMWYGNSSAFNGSYEAWQDMTGKALTFVGQTKLASGVIAGRRVASFDGTADYIDVADSDDFSFGTGNFSIEWTFRPQSITTLQMMCSQFLAGTYLYLEYRPVQNEIKFVTASGGTATCHIAFAMTPQLGVTKKYNLSRTGTALTLTQDGVALTPTVTTAIGSNAMPNSTGVFRIGGYAYDGSECINGYLLGMRITKGYSRAGQTVPDAYTVDRSEVVFCSNFDTVYDANYLMVQHMGSDFKDATGNGYNGTPTGTTLTNSTYGNIRTFNGSSDKVSIPAISIPANGNLTVLHLSQIPDPSYIQGMTIGYMPQGTTNKSYVYFPGATTAGTVSFTDNVEKQLVNAPYVKGNHDVVCVRAESGTGTAFVNGTSIGTTAYSTHSGWTANFLGHAYTSYWHKGTLANMRVSNFARSNAWIKAESLAIRNGLSSLADMSFLGYYTSGTFVTPVADFSSVVAPEVGTETLTKTLDIPVGTTASIEYATSSDNVSWSGYTTLSTPTLPWSKYLKFRVNFATDVGSTFTPEFKNLTLGYKTGYSTEGYWTSEVLNTAVNGFNVNSIAFGYTTLNTGTGVQFQTRYSSDNVSWSAWVDTAYDSLPVSNYMQYRMKLTPNTALTFSPQHMSSYVGYASGFVPTGSWTSQVYDTTAYKQLGINMLISGAFADFVAVNPVTRITAWIKTSYNNAVWTPWQKFDFENDAWDYDDISMNPYVQFKIDYETTNEMQTPILSGFTFTEKTDMKVAVWTSQPIDVSMAKTLDSGKIIAQYVNGGGTLTIMSRTSPDGLTGWSTWQTVDAGYSMTNPPNNFVQIRVMFYGYSSQLDDLVLSMDGNASVKVIGTGLSLGTQYQFTVLRDKLIIANGKDVMRKWDGITPTVETLGGSPPIMKTVVTHHNRVWGVDANNQSRVRYSDILDPETWGAFNFIDFNPEDGDYITALFRYGQNLIVSKQRSMALVTGNKTTNYNVSWLDSEQGVTGERALCQADKYVCYIAQDGIRFTDLSTSIVATERLVDEWRELNHQRLQQASLIYWQNKLLVALPEKGSLVNNVVWVYDFLRNAWSIYKGWSVATWLRFHQYGEDILLCSDSNTGQVYEALVSTYDDDTPITYRWKSKDFHFNYPERYKLFRTIYVDIEGVTEATELEIRLFVDGIDSGMPYHTTIPAGEGLKHTRRILPPLYNAVLGRSITLEVIGRCGIQGIAIEYVVRGAVPGEV